MGIRLDKQLLSAGLTHDPCVCGDVDTWHPSCYQGLSPEEIRSKYKFVMSKLRRRHVANAKNITRNVIALVKL